MYAKELHMVQFILQFWWQILKLNFTRLSLGGSVGEREIGSKGMPIRTPACRWHGA